MALKASATEGGGVIIESNGENSSEYKMASRTNKWMNAGAIAGVVIAASQSPIVAEVVTGIATQSSNAQWGGIALAALALVGRILTTFGFGQNRAKTKVGLANAAANASKR